jgi:hypothetical protein
MWESVPEDAGTDGWAELDDNGWGALMGWSAGAENLRRIPVDDTARTVRVTTTGPTGVRRTEEAFTAEDRLSVDEDANSYLADAGAPQRPNGFTWYIRLPQRFAAWEDFRRTVIEEVHTQEPAATHPAEIAPVMRQVVCNLYE